MQEVPLKSGAVNSHQVFTIQLGKNLLNFEVNYISYLDAPAWSMNIYKNGVPLVYGAMLEPGSDIVELYGANIGRLIFVGEEPTIDNLGVDNHLVWLDYE